MRDYIVLIVILGAAPVCLFSPFFGVLMWSWIAYFNPHRFTWGIAYDFPVAMVIAVPTLVGSLMTSKMNRRFLTRESFLLLLLWIWFVITLFHASLTPILREHYWLGKEHLIGVSKILLMTYLMILLTNSKSRLRYLFLVTAFSFGAMAIKGAVFGFVTEGRFRVWGPPDSFVADNNDFALAMNLALPMMFFLAREEKKRWMRILLRICFFAGIMSVLLTYSRGGLLGLAIVVAVIAVKTHHKFLAAFMVTTGVLLILLLAPPRWMNRMDTLFGGTLDQSARQRLASWKFAWNVAKEFPVTGGGMETFTPRMFDRYAAEPIPGGYAASGPHSIYFQMVAEQGFVGLALFLAMLLSCGLTLRGLRRSVRYMPSSEWIVPYTHMLEASFAAYLVSGAFLGRAYFDLFYQLVAGTVILRILYRKEVLYATYAAPAEAQPELAGASQQPALP